MAKITTFFRPEAACPNGDEPEKVDRAAEAAEDSREGSCVQEFVDFFVDKARHPLYRGRLIDSRKVAVFGERYFWGDDVTHPHSALPESFNRWCEANGLPMRDNSVLVNVYPEAKSYIGWHSDSTSRLDSPLVMSVSFAMRTEDRGSRLAEMEFRWPLKKSPGTWRVKKQALRHGTVVRFDARKHEAKRCQHRVAKTLLPRVNVTFRALRK